MKLDKLILVNWGALRSDEYPMGNMTLFTGPTGSGKSTFLDALQTIMTAVYHNVFNYNPSQDETTQNTRNGKTKRTLWSYIVGAEDNLFARPDGAHGYIAAVFKPSEGEIGGKEFTALVAAAARVDGSGDRRQAIQERLVLLIIDDASLKLEDLVIANADGDMQVVPAEKIEGHLKSRYHHVTSFRESKREYLCQLYGRFRGQKTVSFNEAELAAKAWSQSIAYKPIGSVDDLVKVQILEHNTQQLSQRISQISDLMRQVHNLRVEGERLKENVSRLETIGESINQATSAYEKATQYQLLVSKRSLMEDERQIAEARRSIIELNNKIDKESATNKGLAGDKASLNESLVQIAARLSGIPAAEQKSRIDGRLNDARQAAKDSVESLLQGISHADNIQTRARTLIGMEFPATHRVLQDAASAVGAALTRSGQWPFPVFKDKLQQLHEAEELDPRMALGLVRELENLEGRFDELHQILAGTQDSFVAAVHGQSEQLRQVIEGTKVQERELAQRKKILAEGGADYPPPISVALKAFRSDLPSARVQVLCDLIEPLNEEWQPAIEGYMGGARFNFVVDQDWEGRSIEFIRERHLRANVIQGALCLKNAKPERTPSESIIHELHTEHPIAKAYLVDSYGSVIKVDSSEQLRYTPRGVMRDGKGSGSRTMFTADADSMAFGKEAQRNAREKVVAAHAKAEAELQELGNQQRQLTGLLALVRDLQLPSFKGVAELDRAATETESAFADLARLDLTEVSRLEDEKNAIVIQVDALDTQIQQANQRIGGHRNQITGHQSTINRLESGLETKQQKVADETGKLKNLCVVNEALSFLALEQEVYAILEGAPFSQQQLQGRIQALLVDASEYNGDVRETMADYNQHAHADEQLDFAHSVEHRGDDFAPTYGALVKLRTRVRERLNAQREIGLVKNLDQLRQAEGSFTDVFTKQFCYEIRNAVDSGVKTLRALNTELEKLKFGTDKFRIDWSVWVPEFKEYYDFFSAAYDLSESQESGDLFVTTELSSESCNVRDRLVSLLMSNDQERALKELQRIADYRNYRRYEIWKESDSGSRVALSEWGTGSGGQLETPAYIIRAAVVTNRLRHFDKGMSLRMLVNDESFSRMDEQRARDVIKFIRDNLGIQLICAMPTKHAGAIKPEFTKEWCFTRTEAEGNGEVDFVSEADERDLNPDKLLELWETRRQQVRLQAQIAFEAREQVQA